MIKRRGGYLESNTGEFSPATLELHERGFVVLKDVLASDEVRHLTGEIDRVFTELPTDDRLSRAASPENDMHRYEMLNRSAACQHAVGHARVLETIEPLLGHDCHVIANTAWRNPHDQSGVGRGDAWHIDAGPHVPRPAGTRWPDEIPYPIFAVAAHFLLLDSRIEDGPTGAIPGSHRSGQHPPFDSMMDRALEYDGEGCVSLLGCAGDVVLFASDVWHCRMPALEGAQGRYFLQSHYARRDIAQRLRPTAEVNHVSEQAVARAETQRERTLIGLHDPLFYDG